MNPNFLSHFLLSSFLHTGVFKSWPEGFLTPWPSPSGVGHWGDQRNSFSARVLSKQFAGTSSKNKCSWDNKGKKNMTWSVRQREGACVRGGLGREVSLHNCSYRRTKKEQTYRTSFTPPLSWLLPQVSVTPTPVPGMLGSKIRAR